MSPLYSTDNGSRVSTYGGMLPAKNAAPMPARTRPDGVPSIRWPSQRHLAPRRCGNCNAALLRTVVPTAEEPMVDVECLYCSRVVVELKHDAMRAPMTPAEFAALPTQQGKRTHSRATTRLCPVCGQAQIRARNDRCRACWARDQWEGSHAGRLVKLLGDGQRHRRSEICDVLGIDSDHFRVVVHVAEQAGHTIQREGWHDSLYWLVQP